MNTKFDEHTIKAISAALADGCAVIDMDEACIDRLDAVQWEVLNLSFYDVRRYKNFLVLDDRAAGELRDMVSHGAQHHNSLFEEERVEFGHKHRVYFVEKWAEEAAECGVGLLEDLSKWGYWERNGIDPTTNQLVQALAGVGPLADDMAELMTLSCLENIARLLFDCDAEVTLEELNA